MKIEKVEDLGKLEWRSVKFDDFKCIMRQEARSCYWKAKTVYLFVTNKYREIARMFGLPEAETIEFFHSRNFKLYEYLQKYMEHEESCMYDCGISRVTELLKLPVVSEVSAVAGVEELLYGFEQLDDADKARFVAEIWKSHIAPEIQNLIA